MREREYVRSLFAQEDEVLQSITQGLEERGFPQISISSDIGKTLQLLVNIANSDRILEIGALGGYSTIWLARGLSPRGRIVSIELKKEHADFARQNVSRAGLENQVTFLVGDANERLDQLIEKGERFDFFFIDADKPNYASYLEKAVQLSTPGAVIVADNLFQGGRIFDPAEDSLSPVAIREFNQIIAEDSRLDSVILPIGDGIGVCKVKSR